MFNLGLIVISIIGGVWWIYIRKFQIKYTKIRLLGLEIDRAIVTNKFHQKNRTKSQLVGNR